MQKIALAQALACAPAVCLAANDDALFNTLNAGLDAGIASLQSKLPLEFGPGMTVTAARRESRTIIYTLDFQPRALSAVGGHPRSWTICVRR
jgi:hypothetical protein